jgi:hypothetical protein
MSKLSVRYKEEIKTLALVCRARGFNPRQTVEYVNEHLAIMHTGKTVSDSYVQRLLETSRAESNEWLRNLGHGKSDYIALFRDIIDRLNIAHKELYELIDQTQASNDRNRKYVIIKAYAEIHQINKTLWQLYKDIPLLLPGTAAKSIEGIVMEDTTGVYPEIST